MVREQMPIRVGVDLTSVRTVEESIRAHGDRYLRRVYTDGELSDCRSATGVNALRLAARFAVKEATMKVLRPDESDAVPWRTVAVSRGPSGSIEVELQGSAAELAARRRILGLSASLSHEQDLGVAVVVAELAQEGNEDG